MRLLLLLAAALALGACTVFAKKPDENRCPPGQIWLPQYGECYVMTPPPPAP